MKYTDPTFQYNEQKGGKIYKVETVGGTPRVTGVFQKSEYDWEEF